MLRVTLESETGCSLCSGPKIRMCQQWVTLDFSMGAIQTLIAITLQAEVMQA